MPTTSLVVPTYTGALDEWMFQTIGVTRDPATNALLDLEDAYTGWIARVVAVCGTYHTQCLRSACIGMARPCDVAAFSHPLPLEHTQ